MINFDTNDINALDFDKMDGLIPTVIQDQVTKDVLMLGFMNRDALDQTIQTGKVTFYSRTKKRLWTKGEQSGHFLNVRDMYLDCDKDTLLILAKPMGPVCHKGTKTCFEQAETFDLFHLEGIIQKRRTEVQQISYVHTLTSKGIAKVAQKVGEESVEMVIEAMKNENAESFIDESADLLFHYLILLQMKGFTLQDVVDRLATRHKKKPTQDG